MEHSLARIKEDYLSLPEAEKVLFLEWLNKEEPWKWEFATLTPHQRKFYDSREKRG